MLFKDCPVGGKPPSEQAARVAPHETEAPPPAATKSTIKSTDALTPDAISKQLADFFASGGTCEIVGDQPGSGVVDHLAAIAPNAGDDAGDTTDGGGTPGTKPLPEIKSDPPGAVKPAGARARERAAPGFFGRHWFEILVLVFATIGVALLGVLVLSTAPSVPGIQGGVTSVSTLGGDLEACPAPDQVGLASQFTARVHDSGGATPDMLKSHPTRFLGFLLGLLFMVTAVWPTWFGYVAYKNPLDFTYIVGFLFSMPLIGLFPKAYARIQDFSQLRDLKREVTQMHAKDQTCEDFKGEVAQTHAKARNGTQSTSSCSSSIDLGNDKPNTKTGGLAPTKAAFRSVVAALNKFNRTVPSFVSIVLLASSVFIGANHVGSNAVSTADAPIVGSSVLQGVEYVHVPFRGAWLPDVPVHTASEGNWSSYDASGAPAVVCASESIVHAASTSAPLVALINASAQTQAKAEATNIPVISATPDSGCTGSCTDKCSRLINQRACNEIYGAANGHVTRCTVIGDLPVFAKTLDGAVIRIVFTNVRCVPDFKYTLLSVTQLWEEQRIDARFRDLNHLQLPAEAGGHCLPYDKELKLSTLVLVSEKELLDGARSPKPSSGHQSAFLGFHAPKSVSHIARLSAAQAGELIHRRSMLGTAKIRKLADITSDAPKNVTSSPNVTSVHSAAARIRKAAHPGKLHASAAEPGDLHIDLKGPFPPSLCGKFQYAVIAIDQHTRYVFVAFIQNKSEAPEAVKKIIAEFNATVGTPTDEDGKPMARPTVRRLHRDHEGGLESRGFEAFRADASLHSTTSAPHDHDLNPIAESTIHVLDDAATAMRSQCGAPISFWPELMLHAVNWHNASSSSSIGSSTSDPGISCYQRFRLTQPRVMDLGTFGSRAVVLKPPQHQTKGDLSSRGWVGCFLGRSPNSPDTWEVWVPAIGRKVRSSSLLLDEEYFPWLGKDAYQPLKPTAAATHAPVAGLNVPAKESNTDTAPAPDKGANDVPNRSLHLLNLFSGPYNRSDGLSARMADFGWGKVTNIDNSKALGGGWGDDLLNDRRYAELLETAEQGGYDAIMIAFPCSTFSIARFFDATTGLIDWPVTNDTSGRGPPPVRTSLHPDGLPEGELNPRHVKELGVSNRLLDRTAEIAIAAHRSPRRTTIVFENPADRTDEGAPHHISGLPHGSLFATEQIQRVMRTVGSWSKCSFALCSFNMRSQKYTTLLYTNDAATVLDQLNEPRFQCNHPPGAHAKIAGGRDAKGDWASAEEAAYPDAFCIRLAMAFTMARTGSPKPIASCPPAPPVAAPIAAPTVPIAPTAAPTGVPAATLSDIAPRGLSPSALPASAVNAPVFVPSGGRNRSPASPVAFRGFDTGGAQSDDPWGSLREQLAQAREQTNQSAASPAGSSPGINLGANVGTEPSYPEIQGRAERSVRGATRDRDSSLNRRIAGADDKYSYLDAVPEETEPSYVSFTGTPGHAEGFNAANIWVDLMEATVAEIAFDAAFPSPSPSPTPSPETTTPVTDWVECPSVHIAGLAAHAKCVAQDTYEVEVDENFLISLLAHGGLSKPDYVATYNVLKALRADSPDAPALFEEAMARGGPWPEAIGKELNHHLENGTWEVIEYSDLPRGRRLHKFVWVFKMKRDGTAKGRLCVQGCTLEAGVDYDQTFSQALCHSSARALFAFAARRGCLVRSYDWVAAYLQGDFIDGEVVYCKMPPGADLDAHGKPVLGSDGKPRICKVVKPVYGLPQSGRRLQRKIFPWFIETMGMRQLDDSDGCVFVKDGLPNNETFAIGVYVDNLQIVHSAKLDADGNALDPDSFYAKFTSKLKEDWNVVDEGPMDDLLGMQCEYGSDGSITIHQRAYAEKLVERFLPKGPVGRASANPLPFSDNLPRLVIEALDGSTAAEPAYPELVKPYQCGVGALMYLCVATRPDLAYAVHMHCRALSRPTPELLAELNLVFAYVARNPKLGLRFAPGDSKLEAFADASWDVRHSTSGWVVFWQQAPLAWGSRKQQSIALSSCEAEIIALSEAAKDVVYFRKFVSGIDASSIDGPTDCATDSKSAKDLSYNPEHHNRTKHVERRHFFIRDMVEKFELRVPLVSTVNNYADFFTKPLKSKAFFGLRNKIMNIA